MSTNTNSASNTNGTAIIFIGACLSIFLFLAMVGGVPSASERIPPFVIGIAVLVIITITFGFAGWHLLYRPLPAGLKTDLTSPMSQTHYRMLAAGLFVAQILMTVGGVWDEIWHTRYGLAFGEDFWWRPHLMMYVGFGATLLLGVYAWYILMTRAKGTLQQRFRSDKLLGFLALVGAFMAYALPADPIWHSIYGEDLTAWSIPHVLIVLIWILVATLMIGMQYASNPHHEYKSIRHLQFDDLFPIVALAFINMMVLVMFSVEWEFFTLTGNVALGETIGHPDWLYPVFIMFTSTFVGMMVTKSSKRYGTATLIAILTIVVRLALVYVLDHTTKTANPWLLTFSPLVAIDIVTIVYVRRNQEPPLWAFIMGATLAMSIISLPILNAIYIVPEITLNNIGIIILTCALGGGLAMWLAQSIIAFIAVTPTRQTTEQSAIQLKWLMPAVFVTLFLFITWFIVTAQPPVI